VRIVSKLPTLKIFFMEGKEKVMKFITYANERKLLVEATWEVAARYL